MKQEKGWVEKLVAAGKKGVDKVEDKAEDIVKKKMLFLEQDEGTTGQRGNGKRGKGNGHGGRGVGNVTWRKRTRWPRQPGEETRTILDLPTCTFM